MNEWITLEKNSFDFYNFCTAVSRQKILHMHENMSTSPNDVLILPCENETAQKYCYILYVIERDMWLPISSDLQWLMTAVDQWPTCLHSCQWQSFWTYLLIISLFSLYLMNFIFHTMLDAVDNILRLRDKTMKVLDVSFSQGKGSTLFSCLRCVC